MSEEKCEFNMQGWCCCGLTTVPKEIGYADILCSDECNKNCYYKQLRTAKEELQAYKEDRFCQGDCTVYQFDKIKQLKEENENLTQQNKQMREFLEFTKTKYEPYIAYLQVVEDINKVMMALKGVE